MLPNMSVQILAARGVSLPRCAMTIDKVDNLLGDTEVSAPAGDEPGTFTLWCILIV